jgi:hypothetical protein
MVEGSSDGTSRRVDPGKVAITPGVCRSTDREKGYTGVLESSSQVESEAQLAGGPVFSDQILKAWFVNWNLTSL